MLFSVESVCCEKKVGDWFLSVFIALSEHNNCSVFAGTMTKFLGLVRSNGFVWEKGSDTFHAILFSDTVLSVLIF
jgi:hypothetical protein